MRFKTGLFAAAAVVAASGSLANAELAFGTTAQGFLVRFDTNNPNDLQAGVAVTGLATNETIVGLDFRPSNGLLYALGSQSRLYTLNTTTGAATLVGSFAAPALNGSNFGFDFNPVVDLLRVVSDVNQNLRINPNTGANVNTDGNLAFAAGDTNFGAVSNVSMAAYTNSVAGATSTTLYVVDTGLDVLAIQNANPGTLTTVGSLGVNLGARGEFDISPTTGLGYIAGLPVGESASQLFRVNLATGQLTSLGQIAGGVELRTLAIVPTPGAAALLGLGGLLAIRRKR